MCAGGQSQLTIINSSSNIIQREPILSPSDTTCNWCIGVCICIFIRWPGVRNRRRGRGSEGERAGEGESTGGLDLDNDDDDDGNDDGNDDGDDDRYGFSSTFDIKGDQAVLGSGQVVGGYFEVVVMLMMMMMRTDD